MHGHNEIHGQPARFVDAAPEMKTTGLPKGFTIVEVLIVMTLLAIMGSFAVPAWQHYAVNINLKSASREIMADILNTRQRAIAENLNAYRITFDSGANSYTLSRTDTGETLWTRQIDGFGGGSTLNSVNLSGNSFINFQRRGTITDGTIVIKNKVDSTATITTILTGRVYAQYNMRK